MEYEELKKSLEKDYLIIQKGKWWSFLGGAFAFIVIAGLVSYQASIKALEGQAATTATKAVEDLLEKAKTDYADIRKNLTNSEARLLEMDKRLAAMSTFEKSLTDIRDAIGRGNPWVPFTKTSRM